MEEASASTPNGAVLPVPQVQPPPSGQAAESAQPMQQAQQAQQLEELAAGPLGAAPAVNTSAPGEGVTTAPCAVPLGYIPPPSASPGTSMAQPPGGIPAAAQPPGAAPLAGAPGCALPGSAPQCAWQPGSMAQAGMAPGSMPHGGLPVGALSPGTMQPVGTSGGLLPVGTLPFGPFPQFGAAGRQGMPVPPGMPPGSAVPGPGGNYMVGAVTTRLTVTVPAGISGGELVRVAAPDGSYHSVMVPAGLSAGQQFSVREPPAPPREMKSSPAPSRHPRLGQGRPPFLTSRRSGALP